MTFTVTKLIGVVGDSEDDALYFVRHGTLPRAAKMRGDRILLMWPRHLDPIRDVAALDDLLISPAATSNPNALKWVHAVRTRVRGADGRTPTDRLKEGA